MRHVKEGEFKRALETVILYKAQQKAELERIDSVLSDSFLSEQALVKDVKFTAMTYRRLRQVLPIMFNKDWERIAMSDFKKTDYQELFILLKRSKACMKNIEDICLSYGVKLK